MAGNLRIDEVLLARALKAGGHTTKRETVNEALREYVRHCEQRRIVELFGTIGGRNTYDYKAQRRRDSGPVRSRPRKRSR